MRKMKIPIDLLIEGIQGLKLKHTSDLTAIITVSSAPELGEDGKLMPGGRIRIPFERSIDGKSWNLLIDAAEAIND